MPIPSHQYYDRLCAIAAASQTSPEEDRVLAAHMQTCDLCTRAFQDYRQLAAQMYEEGAAGETCIQLDSVHSLAVNDQEREKDRLLKRCREANLQLRSEKRPILLAEEREPTVHALLRRRARSWVSWGIAAALLFALSLNSLQYWRSKKQSNYANANSGTSQAELKQLREELTRIQSERRDGPTSSIAKTTSTEALNLQTANEALRLKLEKSDAARLRRVDEFAKLEAQVRLLQSSIEVLQSSRSTDQAERTRLLERVSSLTADLSSSQIETARLNARNDELSQEALARARSVERQQKLLATDHDIRDILGARSLHIIDVYDVGSQGEFERPFGRIFFTEGKSLIFYAFDLDQQKGLKRGAVFQAWGQKGGEKEDPRSLGAFYIDDPSQNRWVLKVDDGKLLSRIDYVFVTDGSHKEGVRPKGKPLLSAFLNSTANHP